MIIIERSAENIEIDRLFHFMGAATSVESRQLWESRWLAAVKKRDQGKPAKTGKAPTKPYLGSKP